MEYKDYYQVLGVDRNADEAEIKRAYRKLAQQYHPDKETGSEEQFKQINEAYQVLGDPDKRAKYDQLGSSYRAWERRGAPGGFDWSQWTTGQPGGVRVEVGDLGDLGDLFGGGFSDFFNAIFGRGATGGGTAARSAARGRDVEQSVTISLREAYQGTSRTLSRNGKRLEVDIPPGAKTGTRVRVAGQGEAGPAAGRGPSGDLYLRVNVAPEPGIVRRGDDLHVEVEADLYSALLGGEIEVQTLVGPVLLSIPAGSQPGQTFRLRGRGMPKLRSPGKHGDLYAKLQIRLPAELSAEERELFERLAKLSKDPR